MIGRGKLIEDLKYQQLVEPDARTGTTALYNGVAATPGVSIDTQAYDELNVILNAGVVAVSGDVTAALYEHTSDDPSSATAVTSAAFTVVTSANDQAIQNSSIKCKNYKRYMWLRTIQATASETNYSAIAVLGKCDSMPQTNSPVFDL